MVEKTDPRAQLVNQTTPSLTLETRGRWRCYLLAQPVGCFVQRSSWHSLLHAKTQTIIAIDCGRTVRAELRKTRAPQTPNAFDTKTRGWLYFLSSLAEFLTSLRRRWFYWWRKRRRRRRSGACFVLRSNTMTQQQNMLWVKLSITY